MGWRWSQYQFLVNLNDPGFLKCSFVRSEVPHKNFQNVEGLLYLECVLWSFKSLFCQTFGDAASQPLFIALREGSHYFVINRKAQGCGASQGWSWWSDNNEESVLWEKLWASGTSISAWLPGLAPGETDSELHGFFPSEIRPMNGLYIMNEIILKTTAHVTTSFNMECFCSCLICTSTQQTLLVKLFPCERSKLSLVGYFYWEAEKNKAPSVLRLDITPQNGKGIQPNMLI